MHGRHYFRRDERGDEPHDQKAERLVNLGASVYALWPVSLRPGRESVRRSGRTWPTFHPVVGSVCDPQFRRNAVGPAGIIWLWREMRPSGNALRFECGYGRR